MEILLFTIVAIVLYLLADRAVDWLERRRGARFEHRSLIFFVVILVLALLSFEAIERMTPGPGSAPDPAVEGAKSPAPR